MDKEYHHKTNGWKIAFWIFFVLWVLQAIYIGTSINKYDKLQTSYNNLSKTNTANASAQQSCVTNAENRYDEEIWANMLQTAVSACQSEYPTN